MFGIGTAATSPRRMRFAQIPGGSRWKAQSSTLSMVNVSKYLLQCVWYQHGRFLSMDKAIRTDTERLSLEGQITSALDGAGGEI